MYKMLYASNNTPLISPFMRDKARIHEPYDDYIFFLLLMYVWTLVKKDQIA